MAKLSIKNAEQLNEVISKLAPSWSGCFPQDTIEKAQVAKSGSRNFMFGNILNNKFIKLTKACNGFKAGEVVALIDIYEEDSAQSVAGLIIYRLGHPGGLVKEPVIVAS